MVPALHGGASRASASSTRQTPELTIAVVPSRRGKGAGAELLEALLERARADGFTQISLSAEPEDQTGFYETYGFARSSSRRRSRDDARAALTDRVTTIDSMISRMRENPHGS